MGTAVVTVKAALVDLFQGLYPDALVSWGPLTVWVPQQCVIVGNVETSTDRPTMGTARRLEETIEVSVELRSSVYGGDEAQQPATVNAATMFDTLMTHYQTSPGETLGGSCRVALVTASRWVEDVFRGADGEPLGRSCTVECTVTAWARA